MSIFKIIIFKVKINMTKIKRALISVSNKKDIIHFAKALVDLGIEIISTGGTFKKLSESGINIVPVSEITKFPEMLDGRVKTLHPAIHGGILAIRNNPNHIKEISQHNILPIDMVVVNLYPFETTINKPNVNLDEAIENIDIGGPTLIRSAAKNYKDVAVITNPARYDSIINELKENNGSLSLETRQQLAIEAFYHTTRYDSIISNYLFSKFNPDIKFPPILSICMKKVQDLRYGENPHQAAGSLI